MIPTSSDSEQEELIQTTESNEIDKLDHMGKDNIKKNKNQHNDAIEYEPSFDHKYSLSIGTKEPLPVVIFSLIGGKKQRAVVIVVSICLWGIRAMNSMIKRQHNKHYKRKMRYNKLEYSTTTETYYMTHDVKVPFCMPEFYISKIIEHRINVDNNKFKSCMGYDIIIGRYLMVQLGLSADFKCQVVQWDDVTLPMKEPRGLLGKSDLTNFNMREFLMQTE